MQFYSDSSFLCLYSGWLSGSRWFQTESGFELQHCGSLHWKLRLGWKSTGSMLHNTTRQNQAAHLKASFFLQVLRPEIFLSSAKLLLPHLIPLLKTSRLLRFIYPSCWSDMWLSVPFVLSKKIIKKENQWDLISKYHVKLTEPQCWKRFSAFHWNASWDFPAIWGFG